MADDGSNGAQDSGASYDPDQSIGILGNAGFDPAWSAGGDGDQPGILGPVLNPKPWTLADSTIHGLLSPEDIATIDFGDMGQPQPSLPDAPAPVSGDAAADPQGQPDDGGFYTGLTPWQPGSSYQGAADAAATPPASGGKDGWVQLPQPGDLEAGEGGSGYYTYGTDKSGKLGTGPNAQWGTPKTMQVIGAVADKLASGDRYTPFGVGNISLQGGADFSGPYGHAGHRDGQGIDVRPARTDGKQESVTYKDATYDQAATQRLVDAFRSTGQVGTIYFNDPGIRGVTPWPKHDGHLHVQLNQ
jgi:hypothetical protein